MAHSLATCCFCGVGCGIYLETSGNGIVGAYPSMSHPANRGRICVRGWHVHEVASSPDRLKSPLLRRNGGGLVEVSWDEAYGFIAERLRAIRDRHGPDAIGFLNSPHCSNEESYLLQKLARAVIGTNNVDHGISVHRTNTIEALSGMLGIPAATCSIADLEKSDVIVVDGIDLARANPTIGGWVLRARVRGAKVIVVGALKNRIAANADLFVQNRPRTAIYLYGAMAKIIVDRGLMDMKFIKARCQGYEEFLARVQQYDVLWAAEQCGVPPESIEEAALTFAGADSAMFLYASGIEARGIESIQAIVDLVLLTGNLGKPGAGLIPLAEHNNLQGACDMGVLPDHLPGYQPVTDETARTYFGELWGAKPPDRLGRSALSMLGHGGPEDIRALWIDRHNPAVSATLCDSTDALDRCELVVLQHLFLNDTARYADVVLPVVAYGEEAETFTSTERRIQLVPKVIDPPKGPVPAWRQLVEMANRMGAHWEYSSSSAVMNEIRRAVPFYWAASYENLGHNYGRQWPCTRERPLGTPDLYADAPPEPRFRFELMRRPAAPAKGSPEYPFLLSFSTSLYYWHRNVLIRHSETLKREYQILLMDYPEGFVEINSGDAAVLGIRDAARIRVVAGSGSALTFARVTERVRSGVVLVPYFLHDFARQLQGKEGYTGSKLVHVNVEKV